LTTGKRRRTSRSGCSGHGSSHAVLREFDELIEDRLPRSARTADIESGRTGAAIPMVGNAANGTKGNQDHSPAGKGLLYVPDHRY